MLKAWINSKNHVLKYIHILINPLSVSVKLYLFINFTKFKKSVIFSSTFVSSVNINYLKVNLKTPTSTIRTIFTLNAFSKIQLLLKCYLSIFRKITHSIMNLWYDTTALNHMKTSTII